MSGSSDLPSGWTGERYIPEIGGNIRLEHLHRYLIARELASGKKVLDIACGEGYGAAILATTAARVIGVDISKEAIAGASGRYIRDNLEFIIGRCEAIPLPDTSVDLVVSFETIEHIEQHDTMMREVARVLRPDGVLIISSPDRDRYSGALGNRNIFHLKELDRPEFETLLKSFFPYVAIAGQRIVGGSVVGPTEGGQATRFVSFRSAGPDEAAAVGLSEPVYLLALASLTPLPPLPVGLLDGGPFAWMADLDRLLVKVQGQCVLDIARRLGQPVSIDSEATDDAVRAEFTRQVERLSELVREAHALRGVVAETEEFRARDRAHRSELESLRATSGALEAQLESVREQLRIYEKSRSWRITAPLRHLRRLTSRMVTGSSARRVLSAVRDRSRRVRRKVFPDSALTSHPRMEPLPGWFYDEHGAEYVPLNRSAPVETRIKAIAFYLPQFHPIPENDLWWGKGFTEWTSVTRGKPQFAGHYQPHLPGDLGFYDLRIPEVQRHQIELARLHGIHGFCYYHYWFHGKKLLERPLEQMLAHRAWNFPFCICWANENWTRRWDGKDQEVLIAQEHSPEDDLAFIRDLEPALRDSRYIRIGTRPLLLVYRPGLLPDARATAARWRAYCTSVGLGEPFLVSTHAFDNHDPRDFGFDAALEFAPNNQPAFAITSQMPHLNPAFEGIVYDYRYLVEQNLNRGPAPGYRLFRSVAPMWDNEARRPSRGTVFAHSTPGLYGQWLEAAARWTEEHNGPEQPFLFLNAWNEWAEGAHLEPDRRYGYAYLEATAAALERFPPRSEQSGVIVVSHDAYFHGAQVLALNLVKTFKRELGYRAETILCGPGPLRDEFTAEARTHDVDLGDDDAISALARRLYADGFRVALCNTAVVGAVAAALKQAGFAVISLIHELPGLIRECRLEPSVSQIAAASDRVVFPARVVHEGFEEFCQLGSGRALVRPQGLFAPNTFFARREAARSAVREALGLSPSTRIVLAVGYADYRKGIDLFAEAGRRVALVEDDVAFVWVGHQEAAAFATARETLERAGVRDRFHFPGPLRDSDMYFAGADVYLLTSREDPFPSVVVQALDGGLPVIGFEGAGGFAELLRRGCGLLVAHGDTAAMAEALLTLLRAPHERERLVRTGRGILAREFSFIDYARSLIELVQPATMRVSVIVPNYNYAKYLPERLASIVTQTLPPYEILFLDDCSSDASVEIAEAILHDSKLPYRIVVNQTNQGTYRQWLRGIQETSGDLIWIAEADDHCDRTFIARLVRAFDDPDVVLAYCQSRQIDATGRQIAPDYTAYTAEVHPSKWQTSYVRDGRAEIADSLAIKNTIPNVSAVLMRRMDLSTITSKLLSLKHAGDWLLYVHLLESGKIAFIADALNAHRRHGASVTIGGGGLNLMREILMVQEHVASRYAVAPAIEQIKRASLQRTYEYLQLHKEGGPASYKDHPALSSLEWAVTA
jgi:glycosyltransferase involved in cell wall biosynthesis/SAM-dependent methyltransferase